MLALNGAHPPFLVAPRELFVIGCFVLEAKIYLCSVFCDARLRLSCSILEAGELNLWV